MPNISEIIPKTNRKSPTKVPKPAKGTPTNTQRINSGTIEKNEIAEIKNPKTVISRRGLYE